MGAQEGRQKAIHLRRLLSPLSGPDSLHARQPRPALRGRLKTAYGTGFQPSFLYPIGAKPGAVPKAGMERAFGPYNRSHMSVLSAESASSYQPRAKPWVWRPDILVKGCRPAPSSFETTSSLARGCLLVAAPRLTFVYRTASEGRGSERPYPQSSPTTRRRVKMQVTPDVQSQSPTPIFGADTTEEA
jgi:hypothetical protein